MILTTTNSVDGYKIIEYKGIVSGTAVNVQKITMTFNMQKYYSGVSESIAKVKEAALKQLQENAEKLNVNAVIDINIDIEMISGDSVIVVSTTGTAVNIIKE